ncbi:MAG: aminotransferase class I/II-fold pyridoxal phosphate-dependent enzyme [Planctomycetes bacterium]|nr:aminotransferase class I/II-fold pyridoxal phosphate-dependent enzyme [Planctomycetota bacterium]
MKPLPKKPSLMVEALAAYRIPRPTGPIDLRLDGNEGRGPTTAILDALGRGGMELLRRYPDPAPLEAQLAARLNVKPAQVLVTAGADDALDRVCRVTLGPAREIVLPTPTFEMISRYAKLAGAGVVPVQWSSGAYPLDSVLKRITANTALVAVVSPNNPTGAVACAKDLEQLGRAARHAWILADLAYAEFADEDLTLAALALPNAVVVRSLSKAWGLAGLRVGFAVGPESIIGAMRAAGGPYAVSGPSLAFAGLRLEGDAGEVRSYVERIRVERVALESRLRALGADPRPSQANFVLARFADAEWVRDALAGLGIAVRLFEGKIELERCIRITCPGNEASFDRLIAALEATLAPEAVLLDLDGVLADVSKSYRRAVLATAEAFGVKVEPRDVAAAKAEGGNNNDWVLTQRLLGRRGVTASLDDVTKRFETIYQGAPGKPGLRENETLIPNRDLLAKLALRRPLGLVTGRPSEDADRFLRERGIRDLLRAIVTFEDGPGKPDPAPVRLALERLGVKRAWMVGDNPDDVRAARAAGVVPIGVVAPGDDHDSAAATLRDAGAARIVDGLAALEKLLR